MIKKIAVDGGGLCTREGYGNYSFTLNFLKGLKKFYKGNVIVYSFCELKRLNFPTVKLPKKFFSSLWVSLAEIFRSSEIFFALNQALPVFTRGKKIAFLHGFSFYFFKDFYSQQLQKRLWRQVITVKRKADLIVVSSLKVKKEWEKIFGKDKRIIALPFGVPLDLLERNDKAKKGNYFLAVVSENKIKNLDFILKTFAEFRLKYFPEAQLFVVGVKGKVALEGIKFFGYVKRSELAGFYKGCKALLTASFYESFNFPVLECLSFGKPVIGLENAIIPEMRKFCFVSKNKEEFLKNMLLVWNDKILVKKEEILRLFSWKRFFKKLFTSL